MRVLIIDGNSILNRAFYGIKALSNSKGVFTNALTGFMNIYLREVEEVHPDSVCVTFDTPAKTFRHLKFDSYKATRKGMPDELAMQLPYIKKILSCLGVRVLELEGFEADDVIGSVSRLFCTGGDETVILSGDRDILQLIREGVTVRLATNKGTVPYDEKKFLEEYGVKPINLIDIKALMGDTSDNIKGVAGIGEKTALSLIGQYQTIENLYDNIDAAALSAGVKAKLINGKQSAFDSKWLATIECQAPISHEKSDYALGECDRDSLASLLAELEMFKLLDRLELDTVKQEQLSFDAPPEQEAKPDYTTGEATAETLSGLSDSCFIFDEGRLTVYSNNAVYETADEKIILSYFESSGAKRTFECKSAYKYAMTHDKDLNGIEFICDLAGYLLNSQASDYTLKNMCTLYNIKALDDEYSDILCLEKLCDKLKAEIKSQEMEYLLYEIEQPLCEVLASMEILGVKANADGIKEFGESLTEDIATLAENIHALAGHEFNIASPKQLGVVLFEELHLPGGKKTKSGYSTNADILAELTDAHPIVSMVLEYRTLTKLKSTYVDGLLEEIASDGRVHSSFKQTETRTGRISSANPNIQNIPVRKELGRNMRKFFVAPAGYTLLDADYSQIELRVLASMCGDKNMCDAFLSGADIHTRTASQVFGLPEDFIDDDMRRTAKAVNFGIIYGIGAFSLSKDIGVSVAEANKYIADYFASFPEVNRFMDETVRFGLENGYVKTYFGRRRYIPELKASNKMLQAFGKRAAMNAPIQGTAADIIKIAMIRVYKRLKAEKIDARLILQVHDELIVEAADDCKARAAEILECEMNNAVAFAVPITAEVGEGESWYVAKG